MSNKSNSDLNGACPICSEPIPPKKRYGGLQPKYCSPHCRNVEYYRRRGGAEGQRKYTEMKRDKDTRPKIKCVICGKYFRQVGSHIVQFHGITAREYRETYGFDVKRGQLPEDYRALKADYVFENGTVENLKKGYKHRFDVTGKVPKYKRSAQTMARLRGFFKY